MRINAVEAWVVDVPTLSEWMSSPEFGLHGGNGPRTLLRVSSENGREGWGECAGNQITAIESVVPFLFSANPASLLGNQLDLWSAGEPYWARPGKTSTYGQDAADLRHRLRHPLQYVVECALTDLHARSLEISVDRFFGGRWRDRVPTDYWAGRVTPEYAARCAQRGKDLGFRGIKLKTALEDPNVERLEAIRDAVGEEFHVTVDPNGRFYRFDDAWRTIHAMDQVGNLRILEDPFPRFHLEEFVALRKKITARLVVHVDPIESFWSVLSSGAAGGLNLDSHHVGPFQWRLLAGAAEAANLLIWHGGGCDLGVNTAWHLQLASCAPNCRLPGDQSGPWLREHHLLKTSFQVENGGVLVPTGPGIGVDVDLDAVNQYLLATKSWLPE